MVNELEDVDLRYNNINREAFAFGDNAPFRYFFKKYFDFKRFESKLSNRKSFNYSRGITTNGVKISFLYNVNTGIEVGPTHQRKYSQRHLLGKKFIEGQCQFFYKFHSMNQYLQS